LRSDADSQIGDTEAGDQTLHGEPVGARRMRSSMPDPMCQNRPGSIEERCESGRIGLTANEVTFTGPRVQIPPSPLELQCLATPTRASTVPWGRNSRLD